MFSARFKSYKSPNGFDDKTIRTSLLIKVQLKKNTMKFIAVLLLVGVSAFCAFGTIEAGMVEISRNSDLFELVFGSKICLF